MKKKTPTTREQIIALIELHTGKRDLIAYTQTFKPNFFLNSAPFSVQHTHRSLDVFDILNDVANFFIIPEAHASGRVHYHGIIISLKKGKTRKYHEFSRPLLYKLGSVTEVKINDLSGWIDYCLEHEDDFGYLDNYMVTNIKKPYKGKPLTKVQSDINRLVSFDFKMKKFRMKVLTGRKAEVTNEYQSIKKTL